MKIIQHGDLKKNKPDVRFECQQCGCIFVAEWSEYEKHSSQRDGDWYEAHCPECNSRTIFCGGCA